jgi:putative hydrolase of the HAD superfamily
MVPGDLPKAVMFDALGTLVELQPPAPRLRDACRGQLGIEIEAEEAERAMELEIAYYRAHLDQGRDAESLEALRLACASVVREALPPLAAGDDAAIARVLLAALEFRAFADAAPALRALRERGVRLIVVSNWDVSLHEVLARLELAPLLDGVVTSAEVGARKPAREIFEQGLALAGVDASDALHVGDSLAADVEGARTAGIVPVLVRRDGGEGPPGLRVVSGLGELCPERGLRVASSLTGLCP